MTSQLPAPPQWLSDYLATLTEAERVQLCAAWEWVWAHYPADAVTRVGQSKHENRITAAQMVAEMDLLPDAVAATLLADIPRYAPEWRTDVAEQCGASVADLVAGPKNPGRWPGD